jgi:hypothetical protein
MIRVAERDDFAAVAASLSEKDRRDVLARRPDVTPAGALLQLADLDPIAAAFMHEGKLVAVAGAVPSLPRCASAFVFATDNIEAVRPEILQFFKRTLLPTLAAAGVRRVYHVGRADDEEMAAGLEREFGAYKERELKGHGRNGENYVLHAVSLPQHSEEAPAHV